VVIQIKNLKQTSDRLGALATKFGLDRQSPVFADPLGGLKGMLNANQGLNEAGDAAIAVMAGADKAGDEPQKPEVIVLLPVSDYKAFIANYGEPVAEGDVNTIKLPNKADENAYASQWGAYAAITETKELLAKKPTGITPSAMAAKELTDKDITIFANMKALRDKALPKLQQQREQIKAQIQQQMQKQNPQANSQLSGNFIDQLMNAAEQFLKQSQAGTVGFALSDDAIHTTGLMEFDPQGDWGKAIAQFKNSAEPLIAGLPDAKYLFIAGCAIDPEAATKLIDTIAGPFEAELAKLGETAKPYQSYIAAFKSYLKATKSSSVGCLAPSGVIGQDALVQFVSVQRGDANTILTAQRDMFNTQQAMMDAMGTKTKVQVKYNANAKTVAGVQLNQFSTQFDPPGENATPQEMQMQQMMTWMYGSNGMSGVSGAVGADKAIIASGVNDEMLTKLIASAKADDPAVSKAEPVTKVAGQLPKQRAFTMYVALDNVAETVVNYAKQFGMPANIQLPEHLQPIGISGGTEQSAVRMDSVIPAETVQSLISAGMQAYQDMIRNRGAGGAAPNP
jgi:hypothetical protein